ncbi:bifunctional folylpolyglutamate synthase/dihydrofolate synthase, partial [Candidatus Bathyarchaeota archaeon]|nr:bifunctional folylpolyglutamate synthase/dihydrofolate synthase [Candidatus Bathyarchaeota archaeon]
VGGTNGKGSTSAIIASVLQAAGYKVGLYTSPHLEDFRERIKVDGEMIPVEDLTRLLNDIEALFNRMLGYTERMPLRFFDIVTAVCFKYFQEQGVDYGVIEVGLGGRLDATNTLNPLVSVITNIGFEHVNILGPSLEDIAFEKGGIIKPDNVLVTAEERDNVFNVFKEKADAIGTRIVRITESTRSKKMSVSPEGQVFYLVTENAQYNDLVVPLFGDHQIINAATAVSTIEVLNGKGIDIAEEDVRKGLRDVYWPARLEVVSKNPLVVLDCAKDAEATEAVRKTIQSDFTYDRMVAVVSMSSDKNIEGMIENIAQVADHFIITKHSVSGRAAEPEVLIKEIKKTGTPFQVQVDSAKAFETALYTADVGDMVLVIGSVYLAGDARAHFATRSAF